MSMERIWNGMIITKSINKKLGTKTRRPLVYYDLMEGLKDEEEDLIFEIEPKLFFQKKWFCC